jgi:long-chain acyl-CoA synthetase
MIITGGENVYSAEVENVLLQHPAVQACAVFGMPSERWGEEVHAAVVLRKDATADEPVLRLHCRSQLAGYKCPKQIEFVTSLPMTGAGKVEKHRLRRGR